MGGFRHGPPRVGFALNFATSARDTASIRRVYDDVIEAIGYAEELGLDSAWIGQHHFDNTDGPVPSPLVFLATVAERTERITLGTGITTLPLEDPLRLAEDAAVLDVLSGGRLNLGLGTGGANLDGFRSFGLRSEDRHGIFDQKVARFHHALHGRPLVEGHEGPRLFPPATELRDRVFQAATEDRSVRAAARAGDGLQLGAFFDPAGTGQRPKAVAYHEEYARSGHARPPRVAVFRFVYPGDSKEAVLATLEPEFAPRLDFMARRAAISGNTTLAGISAREYLDRVAFYGSPADIVSAIEADPVIPGYASHFVANFSYREEFSLTATRERLRVLATEIAPALGWRPALSNASASAASPVSAASTTPTGRS
jgi:alkanesulfonate monooxygenase SsuD/methylene tetrahydromethanopterin reductase-like flavin-dependent oxidoreductase (luciferase family)